MIDNVSESNNEKISVTEVYNVEDTENQKASAEDKDAIGSDNTDDSTDSDNTDDATGSHITDAATRSDNTNDAMGRCARLSAAALSVGVPSAGNSPSDMRRFCLVMVVYSCSD